MPVRFPPEDNAPPNRRRRGRYSQGRLVTYEQPEQSIWQRIGARIFSAAVLIPLVFIATVGFGILVYYWTVFSGRIDNLLAGEVFTRSAGIYAAPKQLRSGQAF